MGARKRQEKKERWVKPVKEEEEENGYEKGETMEEREWGRLEIREEESLEVGGRLETIKCFYGI